MRLGASAVGAQPRTTTSDWLVPWQDIGSSKRQFAWMMGSAMTLTVVLHLLPGLLHSAGKLQPAQAAQLQAAAQAFNVMANMP